MESHFVVMMYGKSGYREIRHFGISQPKTKETKQKNKLIEDGSPSNNGTNDHHYSKGSGSQPEVVGCDGSDKKNLVAEGGASNSETRASVTTEKYKESLVTPNGATYSDSLKKRLRNDDNPSSEPAANWDVSLCTESEMQVFVVKTHAVQYPFTKMFNLAYKFETDNDEHTRISIIVNVIKNMAERDPVKNMVENQEGDAVKNVVENKEGDVVKKRK
ncbi:hypothetical protein Tco_1323987 [Tanacetum coccineum]